MKAYAFLFVVMICSFMGCSRSVYPSVVDSNGAHSGLSESMNNISAIVENGIQSATLQTNDSGDVVQNTIVSQITTGEITEPYQDGKYLYIPSFGIRFTLPSQWRFYRREPSDGGPKGGLTINLKTPYEDIHKNKIFIDLLMLTEGGTCLTAIDCSNLLGRDDLATMFDIVKKFTNGTYLLGLYAIPGVGYNIVNNKFHKTHFVHVSSFKSDSVFTDCPSKDGLDNECAYGWTPVFDYEKGANQVNDMLGSMEEQN